MISDPAERDTYTELGGRLFDIPPQLLKVAERAAGDGRSSGAAVEVSQAGTGLIGSTAGKKLSNRVAYLLQVIAARPEALSRVLGILDPADLQEDDQAAYLRMVSALERGGLDALGSELAEFPAEEQGLVRRAWASPPPSVDDEVVDKLVLKIKSDAQHRHRLAMIDSLAEAERRRDRAQIELLEAQLNELKGRI
jgi:hypothetical protein